MRWRTGGNVAIACAGATLVTVLSACSFTESTTVTSSTSLTNDAHSFNDADVGFVVDAGTHVTATLTAAQLADGRSSSPGVVALAARIITLKGAEVDTVASWVRTWGRQGADLAHDSAEQSQREEAGGLTAEVMSRLSTLTGPAFDRLFLASLIEHLAQGETIWASEVRDGLDPRATALAEKIAQEESGLRNSADRLLQD